MNKRELRLEQYGISGKRYKELCGFCEQYPEWVDELKYKTDTVKSKEITDMPFASLGASDQTGNLAISRVDLQKKCELIEQTAIQASAEFYQYIIKSVCYEVPVNYLISYESMAISKSAFYELRRYFFYLLDENKKF